MKPAHEGKFDWSRPLSWQEIVGLTVGITVFFTALICFPNQADEIFSLLGVAAALMGLGATALTFFAREADMLPPASDAFLAAADPARPLPPPAAPAPPSPEP